MASISGNQLRDWEYFKNVQFPVLLVNSNGSVCNYNAPAKHIFKFKDSLNGKNIYDLISIYTSKKFTEEDVKIGNENAQILNISTSENGNFEDQVSIYVFPNTIMENGEEGYIFILIKPFKDKERVAEIRHFHYLKTINKISSKSYRYNDMEILSQFVVSELYNEEYNFFHVGIFLRENNFKGEYVYLSALAGESKKLFYENSEDIYRQSIQQGVIGETIRKGRPIIVDNTESVVYYHSTPFFKGKSELCVPIYLIDQVIGAINIESNTFVHFDEVDSSFLQTIADLYAANVHRIITNNEITKQNKELEKYLDDLEKTKKRLEKQSERLQLSLTSVKEARSIIEKHNLQMQNKLEMGAELQKSLLPKVFPENSDLNFFYKYLPTSQLGGDFFDVVTVDDHHIGIIIADVSGHGVSAAMIAAMFKALFNNNKQRSLNPAEILNYLNAEFSHMLNTGDFISAFYLIINTSDYSYEYANAGHPFPLLFQKKSSSIIALDAPGFFIGVFKKSNYISKKSTLLSGDKILFFTDGIIEIRNSEMRQFGLHRVIQQFKKISANNLNGREIIESIYREILKFNDDGIFVSE
jgi:serine phosphatase RsbU (regulator of sigma subunit)/putative methionine-R-sulfoxide reductase with GAF domain